MGQDNFERLTAVEMSLLDKAGRLEQKEHDISDPSSDKLTRALELLNHIEEEKARLEERERIEEHAKLSERASDFIAEFSGSLVFILIHILWFGAWLLLNLYGEAMGFTPFDPYPFGLLTMVVSLEAIMLSTFILISQNRQSLRDRRRDEIDFERDRLDLKVDTLAAETIREASIRVRSIEHELRELNRNLSLAGPVLAALQPQLKSNARQTVRKAAKRKVR